MKVSKLIHSGNDYQRILKPSGEGFEGGNGKIRLSPLAHGDESSMAHSEILQGHIYFSNKNKMSHIFFIVLGLIVLKQW